MSHVHPDLDSIFASIVIPSCNPGRLIRDTLSCCSKISGLNVEVIVVDDGSTDGTPELVEQEFPWIRLHRLNQNSGSGSVARNVGLLLARGQYIKFLDHDDVIQPRGFRRECHEAKANNADIVMARWGVVRVDERGQFDHSTMKIITPPSPARIKEAILSGESVPFTAAALYKKSYLAEEAWDPTICLIDDFDWFCRLAIKGGVIRAVDSISYYWCQHSDSLQSKSIRDGSMYRKIEFERYCIYRKIEDRLQGSRSLTNQDKRLLARRYYAFLKCFALYDRELCGELQKKIYQLDPDFGIDATCEPSRASLWLIRRMGLALYLRLYGWGVGLLRR